MRMTEKLTIGDIARLAGVSRATVSRVLNHKPDVSPPTRERILRIIDAQGYVPDHSAVQLAASVTHRKRQPMPSFPADFLWGAATSAYQIEGAIAEDGRTRCIWETFAAIPGAIHNEETAEVADDHYHHMLEDVELMAALNLKAYRFSVAWPRVLPQGMGQVNTRGLDFYDRLVDALLARNICPVPTLYHWDLPEALHERGGWLTRETAHAFADYAEVVARRLGDRVSWWITHNEPWCASYLGYGLGVHAPGTQDLQSAAQAAHHLLLSHGLAIPRLRSHTRPGSRVGITINLTPIMAADNHAETQAGVESADILHNRWFLDPLFTGGYPQQLFSDLGISPPLTRQDDMALISTPIDFLGVNYYSRSLIQARRQTQSRLFSSQTYERVVPVPGATYTEMAWEIYPHGLIDVLLRVQRDYAPPAILVTENGAAFEDRWDGRNHVPDKRRVEYLREHIQVLEEALRREVPLRGYFVWSLLDNYEWIDGYSKRFGLIYVDYRTQRRIIKESGRWYASFIAAQKAQSVHA
jgi:beta-glucosidase